MEIKAISNKYGKYFYLHSKSIYTSFFLVSFPSLADMKHTKRLHQMVEPFCGIDISQESGKHRGTTSSFPF